MQGQVSKLMASFMAEGVQRFKVSNVIPLVMKDDLRPGSYRPDANAMEDLKTRELMMDAIKRASETGPVIFVASGQHRIAALE